MRGRGGPHDASHEAPEFIEKENATLELVQKVEDREEEEPAKNNSMHDWKSVCLCGLARETVSSVGQLVELAITPTREER